MAIKGFNFSISISTPVILVGGVNRGNVGIQLNPILMNTKRKTIAYHTIFTAVIVIGFVSTVIFL